MKHRQMMTQKQLGIMLETLRFSTMMYGWHNDLVLMRERARDSSGLMSPEQTATNPRHPTEAP